MKTAIKALALVSFSLLLAPSVAAALDAEDATVQGAGFFRRDAGTEDPGKGKGKGKNRKTKTMITVNAIDGRADGSEDGGTLHYSEHTPGGRGTHLVISLECVAVDENTAYMSGTVGDTVYGVKIEDGGSPGKGADEFGFEEIGTLDTVLGIVFGDCGAGDVVTEPIHGGNLTVTDPEA